jgi:hypothetical protein
MHIAQGLLPDRVGRARCLALGRGWLAAGALGLLAACAAPAPEKSGLKDVFAVLESQGYSPNVGLSGAYAPGNVIQTTQLDARGQEQALASPIVFLWGSDCFPDQAPRVSPFGLPESSGREASAFRLDAGLLSLFVPALKIDRSSVLDYRLELSNPQVHTLAKGDLSRRFAQRCVDDLAQALEDGDRIEWYAVVTEAVIADSLTLEMDWRAGTAAGVRLAQQAAVGQQLVSLVSGATPGGGGLAASVEVAADNEKQTAIRMDSPVIVGYRPRPLQPVYGE